MIGIPIYIYNNYALYFKTDMNLSCLISEILLALFVTVRCPCCEFLRIRFMLWHTVTQIGMRLFINIKKIETAHMFCMVVVRRAVTDLGS